MKNFVKIFFFFIFLIFNLYNCDTHESEGGSEEKCCNNATNQQIVVEFTSTVVEHEYIIHFKEYLTTDERKQHIKAALDNQVINNSLSHVMLTTNELINFRSKILRFWNVKIQRAIFPAILMSFTSTRSHRWA